jgi:hypothetical protein
LSTLSCTETAERNFPSGPKELNISQLIEKNMTRFNLTWKGPYDGEDKFVIFVESTFFFFFFFFFLLPAQVQF